MSGRDYDVIVVAPLLVTEALGQSASGVEALLDLFLAREDSRPVHFYVDCEPA